MQIHIKVGAAALGLCAALPAAAVHTETYQIPYFGAAFGYLGTDSVRDADAGEGLQLTFGVPLDNPRNAVEVRFSDYGYKRFDDKKNYQTSLFVDYVRDFAHETRAKGAIARMKPFAAVGAGFIEEDVFNDKHLHFGASVGGGALIPIGFKGWAVRLDGRVQAQANKESCAPRPPEIPTSPCTKEADVLVDYHLALGLQMPLTIFFDRPVPVKAADDCPVVVVDPDTGRRDCEADSDRDGVADAVDQCPGTPSGTAVDDEGCPRARVSEDMDSDGVPNNLDKCHDSQTGFKVDANGCVVAQTGSLAGVTFDPDSARLTAQGRRTLDGVAAMLAGQPTMIVEIASHTDAVGSEAYNTLLSQQRAESVRAYLIGKGVAESRLTAVGYGEAEPVQSNDNEAGRMANRRIEFRIGTGS